MPPLPRYEPAESFELLTGLNAGQYFGTEIVAGLLVRLLDGPRLLRGLRAPPFAHLREHLTELWRPEITTWLLG